MSKQHEAKMDEMRKEIVQIRAKRETLQAENAEKETAMAEADESWAELREQLVKQKRSLNDRLTDIDLDSLVMGLVTGEIRGEVRPSQILWLLDDPEEFYIGNLPASVIKGKVIVWIHETQCFIGEHSDENICKLGTLFNHTC